MASCGVERAPMAATAAMTNAARLPHHRLQTENRPAQCKARFFHRAIPKDRSTSNHDARRIRLAIVYLLNA